MSETKKEVAIIDFTKFDIAQLPELKGKKNEIAKLIKANPIVEVMDNASYELAKKSRTAVKTLRTSLEKEKKDVNDRIKKNVLEVVANEYDSLIESVKNDENARQKPVTDWEEKKEQERLEKARLEQERIDGIKKSIYEFRINQERFIDSCVFESIDATKTVFEKSVAEFDRTLLGEYEVLFTDAVSYLTNLLNSRIKTLEEQESIRLEQIRLAEEKEKQEAEAKRIAEQQRIEREKFESEQKAAAEKIRIAQEKFLAEKKEFEEKQAEAKTKERIKLLLELGLVYDEKNLGYKIPEIDGHLFFDWQISSFDENNFNVSVDWYKEKIEESKNPKAEEQEVIFEEVKSDESANNQGLSTRLKAGNLPHTPIEGKIFSGEVEKELTWVTIINKFQESEFFNHDDLGVDVLYHLKVYLSKNYSVPTPKN